MSYKSYCVDYFWVQGYYDIRMKYIYLSDCWLARRRTVKSGISGDRSIATK